jgi:hypothetical protein
MSARPEEVARNEWGTVLSTRDMNDDGFKATLELFRQGGRATQARLHDHHSCFLARRRSAARVAPERD